MGYRVITTVVSAAKSYDLVDRQSVKDELGITDNSKDALIDRYISSVSAAVAQYCNRKFNVETVKDEIWLDRDPYPYQLPGGADAVTLTRWPIVANSITSITENAVALVENTDFRADYDRGGLIRLDGNQYPKAWPAWPIVVQYDGGFATIPFDVQDAVVRMIKARYLAKGRDPFMKQENIPGVRDVQYWIATGTDAGNMPPDVADILDNYRVPLVV